MIGRWTGREDGFEFEKLSDEAMDEIEQAWRSRNEGR